MKLLQLSILTVIACCTTANQSMAQLSFTNQVSQLTDPTHYSGLTVAVNDVNNDGLDDIVILDNARDLKIEFQGLDGVWTSLDTGEEMDGGNAWGIAVGDVTNNGQSDVLSGTSSGSPDYAKANTNGTVYTISELPSYSLFTQCVNLADMDADGDLDFFSCNDVGPSGIWENDGNGDFSYSGDYIIPMTPTPNVDWPDWDGSGNYGSTFTDYDLDGDLDFYITHCRQITTTSDNPKLINQMFINDGNGNYAEDFTNVNQLRIGAQSWTTDFQDFDNDGDFDAFITNHNVDNMLLENVNGVFTDIFPSSGLDMAVSTPIQGLMRDFDNDMYVDVIVTGSGQTTYALYHNNGDKTFTRMDGVLGNNGLYSLATGDMNHDGFLDIYGSYATIYTNPSNTPDAVWINDGNDNNWLAVDLEGTISNRSAIGAVVRMYGSWGMQVREVRSGESYGICNSLTSYFGLAQNTDIDSVVVDWPSSGIHQVVENPSPNQFLTIIENECVAPEAFITSNGPTVLCFGQTLDLMAPTGTNFAYEWSTGEQTQQVTISSTGTYMVRVTDTDAGSACSAVSAAIEVEVSPDETPDITVVGELTFCEGESVALTSSIASAYEWSTGATDQQLNVTEGGSYSVTITGVCDDFTSDPIVVTMLDAPAPTANDVQIPIAGSADLNATGLGTEFNWYDTELSTQPIGTGANYTAPSVTVNPTSFWVEEVNTYGGGNYVGSKSDTTSAGGAYHNSTGFYLIFDVLENMTLKSVKVNADGARDRTVYVEDENGTTIHSQLFTIPDGESRIDFTNWTFTPGTGYRLRVLESGHGFWRDNNDLYVNFPYDINGIVTVTGANTGSPTYYYYYYDWEVEPAATVCISERTEVIVTIGTVGVNEGELSQVEVYPNPSTDYFNVLIPGSIEGKVRLELMDALGNLILSKNLVSGVSQIDASSLASGIYMLELSSDNGRSLTKISVQ